MCSIEVVSRFQKKVPTHATASLLRTIQRGEFDSAYTRLEKGRNISESDPLLLPDSSLDSMRVIRVADCLRRAPIPLKERRPVATTPKTLVKF